MSALEQSDDVDEMIWMAKAAHLEGLIQGRESAAPDENNIERAQHWGEYFKDYVFGYMDGRRQRLKTLEAFKNLGL